MYIRKHSEGVSPQIYSLVTTRAISLTISPLVIAYIRTLQVSNSFSLQRGGDRWARWSDKGAMWLRCACDVLAMYCDMLATCCDKVYDEV